MNREVRWIKPGWQHPQTGDKWPDGTVEYVPLKNDNLTVELAEWHQDKLMWDQGMEEDWAPERHSIRPKKYKPRNQKYLHMSWEEWNGSCEPAAEQYMPQWEPGEATLCVMYETTTEGTPISPPFETVEQLSDWLTRNHAPLFADITASYEEWLQVCKQQ